MIRANDSLNKQLNERLNERLNVNEEMKKMKESKKISSKLNADILSIKLQATAHNFYTSIWYSLTKEEKFMWLCDVV